ncbi:MAG: UDP-3-O-(3-hydroxymyristoyl)glucosamine N-acyltransferase [Coraliomargaritaceae bacterium]
MQFSFSIQQIQKIVGSDAEIFGDFSGEIHGLASLVEADAGDLSFLGNPKYRSEVATSKASVLLLPRDSEEQPKAGQLFIKVENPSWALAQVCREIERLLLPRPKPGIHSTAVVEAGAEISPEATIGAFCFVGEGAYVGAAHLQNHVSIGRHAEIGDGSLLYSRVTIADYCRIGRGNRILQGAVVGSDGFGYEFEAGQHERVPQIGRVVTGPDVDIGANTTIDRARFGETYIGEGTKIDNLVQVGHNVRIGKRCLLVAQVGVSGSTELGNGVVVGGKSGFAGHLKIGDGAMIAGNSGIIQSVAPGEKLMGYPGIPSREFLRISVLMRKLPDFFKRFEQVEKYFESELKS